MRLVTQCYFKHLIGCRHLKVQGAVDFFHKPFNVLVDDVPPVFPQMGCYSVGTSGRRKLRCSHRIRMEGSACIPDRRDVVDIDT